MSKEEEVTAYVTSLCREIELYHRHVNKSEIRFIYFGGGTPSVLTEAHLVKIFEKIYQCFQVSPACEVTLESHPTHLVPEFLDGLRNTPVSRISSGIQSFSDRLLNTMGSQHSAADAFKAIEHTAKYYGGISIDLLYRCPGQTPDDWKRELETALHSGAVNHFSCYSLILKSDSEQPALETDAEMAVLAYDLLQSNHYHHYASCASGGFDFALEGKQCKYELEHWQSPQCQYIGLGPGAFGAMGDFVTVNGLTVDNYIRRITSGDIPLISATVVTPKENKHRFFAVGVKTLEVSLTAYYELFGERSEDMFEAQFAYLAEHGLATVTSDTLRLTKAGVFFVDNISRLFYSAEQHHIPHPEEPEIRRAELGYYTDK